MEFGSEFSAATSASANINKNVFCNNCRKYGHIFSKCKLPIMSCGVVAFRINPETNMPEYLMICRRNTLGFVDFMRGKYSPTNKYYLLNMFKQMTQMERESIVSKPFIELWNDLWQTGSANVQSSQYDNEENQSSVKFGLLARGVSFRGGAVYTLKTLVEECSDRTWVDPEWGFPKGRRNYQEEEYECAIREFTEETGYSSRLLNLVKNVFPFEEIFMGSNYKSYKHKYFLMGMNYEDSIREQKTRVDYEVSRVEWKTLAECEAAIRDYNWEKKQMIRMIDASLRLYLRPETVDRGV